VEEKLLEVAHFFYTRVEKRSLPLEASKSLISGHRDIARLMLRRVKKHLSSWIWDSSQVQVYQRYFNYLLVQSSLSLGECFSPFILTSCEEEFREPLLESPNAFKWLRDYFCGLNLESLTSEKEPERLLEKLLGRNEVLVESAFPVSTHIAYMFNPRLFVPITLKMVKALEIEGTGSYLRLVKSLKDRRIKPIEAHAFLRVFYEGSPSKRDFALLLLGVDRELELLLKASELWNMEEFYLAHEVLEEVWSLSREKDKRNYYQGVIRFALALHHYKNGDIRKALKVINRALPQLQNIPPHVRLNAQNLYLSASDMSHKLKNGKPVSSLPTLEVV